jgi:hypothetical protein
MSDDDRLLCCVVELRDGGELSREKLFVIKMMDEVSSETRKKIDFKSSRCGERKTRTKSEEKKLQKFEVCEIWKNRSIEKRGMKHCLKKTLFTAVNRVNLRQCFFPGIHRTHPYIRVLHLKRVSSYEFI